MQTTADFDRLSRHILSAAFLREALEPPGPILEVGGSQGYTRDLLPNYRIVVSDIAGPDVTLRATATQIPFGDSLFQAVLALDMFEHVPESMRHQILEEMGRTARNVIVIAGPFNTPGVAAAEERVRTLYQFVAGRSHRWLGEHHDYRLPDLGSITSDLTAMGFTTALVPSNPIEMWEQLQLLNFAAAATDAHGPAERVHDLLNTRLIGGGDQEGQPYRHVIVAMRDGDPAAVIERAMAALRSPSTRWTIRDAKREIERGLAETLRQSVLTSQRLERFIARKQQETEEIHQAAAASERRAVELERRQARGEADLAIVKGQRDDVNRKLQDALGQIRSAEQAAADAAARADLAEAKAKELEEYATETAEAVESMEQIVTIRRRVAAIRRAVVRESSELAWQTAEIERAARLFRRVRSDVDHVVRSRRWRVGNALGRIAELGRKRGAAPAVDRVSAIADEFAAWKAEADSRRQELGTTIRRIDAELEAPGRIAAGRLDRLEQVVGELARALGRGRKSLQRLDRWKQQLAQHAKRLEQSRRWRMGSAIGSGIDAITFRKRGENAVTRMRRRIDDYEPPGRSPDARWGAIRVAPPPAAPEPGSGDDGPARGLSLRLDRQADNEIYRQYIERVEPEVLSRLGGGQTASIRFVVLDLASARAGTHDVFTLQQTVAAAAIAGQATVWTDEVRERAAAVPAPTRVIEGIDAGAIIALALRQEAQSNPDSRLVFLLPGDIPRSELGTALAGFGTRAAAITFDHDEIDPGGIRSNPSFKPGFSPDLLAEHDYVGRGVAFLARDLGEIDLTGLNLASLPRDLLFRLWAAGRRITRVEAVLLHCPRGDVNRRRQAEIDCDFAEELLPRLGWQADALRGPHGVRIRHHVPPDRKVSVIVPFKDKPDLLRTAVESIRRLTSFPNYELVLVDNDSKDQETIRLLDELSQDPRIRVVAYPEPFNYSRANNLGVEHAAGDVLVFLNNDTQVLTPNWLDDLAGRASHPQIGAVGGLLSFADGSIQHAGVVIGMRGFASHLFAGEQPGLVPPEWLLHARDTSAVTAACLAVERSKYEEVGGFDETFQLTGNDVDLCVRLLKAGYRNVIDPWVRLFHFEKQSRATIPVPRNDQLLSFRRYQPYLSDGDPYFNSNLSLNTNRLVARTGEEGGIEQIRKQLFGGRKNAADQVGFLERYDAGAADLAANAAVMDAFARDRTGPIDRISWFIPSFDHIYRGGIYTIMRIANSFTTRAGTTNCFVVCGNDAADVEDMVEQARAAFPEMKFTLRLLRSHDRESDLEAADIGICTLWTTAYHLLKYNQCRGKFYLVQDFEPGFAPANAVYGLIEQTYRFGFCGIANTKGVGDAYRSYGNETMHFTPAVDRSVFHPAKEHATPPTRIVFYGRPKNPRNGFELGLQALTEVKTRYGDRVEITSVGAVFEEAAYGVENVLTNLGILPGIEAVADLYRASDIGLVFMFTKHPSYQPLEYMASGCATVTNVNESNAWLLKHRVNALVVPPTVGSVADAISELVEDPDLRTRVAKGGLETVGSRDWESQLDLIYGFVTEGATVE